MELQDILDRINAWIGQSVDIDIIALDALAWALAMDEGIQDDLNGFINDKRTDYEAEREELDTEDW